MGEGGGRRLLTADQYLTFLSDGFLLLQPESLDAADHRFFHRRATDLYGLATVTGSKTSHLDIVGDNLRAQIPEIEQLLADPVIDGALRSVLGPDYLIHPHHFCHRSSDRDQIFHQDGNLPWNERGHYRSHRPDWALLFYYPQAVDDTNGPTEIVPGSQYWTVDNEIPDGGWHPGDRLDRTIDDEIFAAADLDRRDRAQAEVLRRGLAIEGLERRRLQVPAGTVVLAHYDLVHRGTRVAGHPEPRYLYKFYFARVHEPAGLAPVPTSRSPRWSPAPETLGRPGVGSIVDAGWSWLRGQRHGGGAVGSEIAPVASLGPLLLDGNEEQRLDAAYRLGAVASGGTDDAEAKLAIEALERGLRATDEGVRRAAGYGLRRAGEAGVPVLVEALDSPLAPVRRPAVAGLGTTIAASSPGAVTAVIAALADDPDDLVRSNAAYSLGMMARSPLVEGGMVVDALLDRLAPGAEPDNAFGAGLSRSTVRQSAAFALVQALSNHRLDQERIDRIIDGPLGDGDRYVQGLAAEALARAEAMPTGARRALSQMAARRWNPTPS